MAGRSNTTLKKRQKEMARAEKQREKVAKRIERKKGEGIEQPEIALEDTGEDSPSAAALSSDPARQPESAPGEGVVVTPPVPPT